MSKPITIENCQICGTEFQLDMKRYSGNSQYYVGDASMVLCYQSENVEDCAYGVVCLSCLSIISNRVRVIIQEIKQQNGNVERKLARKKKATR